MARKKYIYKGFSAGIEEMNIRIEAVRMEKYRMIDDLMKALGVTTRQGLIPYKLGRITPSLEKMRAIRKVFREYGIKEPFDK